MSCRWCDVHALCSKVLRCSCLFCFSMPRAALVFCVGRWRGKDAVKFLETLVVGDLESFKSVRVCVHPPPHACSHSIPRLFTCAHSPPTQHRACSRGMRGRAPVGVRALSPTCLCAVYVCVGSLMRRSVCAVRNVFLCKRGCVSLWCVWCMWCAC